MRFINWQNYLRNASQKGRFLWILTRQNPELAARIFNLWQLNVTTQRCWQCRSRPVRKCSRSQCYRYLTTPVIQKNHPKIKSTNLMETLSAPIIMHSNVLESKCLQLDAGMIHTYPLVTKRKDPTKTKPYKKASSKTPRHSIVRQVEKT